MTLTQLRQNKWFHEDTASDTKVYIRAARPLIMASKSYPPDIAKHPAGPLNATGSPSRRTCSSKTQPHSPDRSVLRLDLVLHLFDRFEVFDRLDSQFVRGVLTADTEKSAAFLFLIYDIPGETFGGES